MLILPRILLILPVEKPFLFIGNTFLQITVVVTTGTIKRTPHRMHLGNAILESFCILQCVDAIQYHFYARTGFIYLRKQASSVLFYVEICIFVCGDPETNRQRQADISTDRLTDSRQRSECFEYMLYNKEVVDYLTYAMSFGLYQDHCIPFTQLIGNSTLVLSFVLIVHFFYHITVPLREAVLWSVNKTYDQRITESESNRVTLDLNDAAFMACVIQFVTSLEIQNEIEDEITWCIPSSSLTNPPTIVQRAILLIWFEWDYSMGSYHIQLLMCGYNYLLNSMTA